jgi:hypothetical protein
VDLLSQDGLWVQVAQEVRRGGGSGVVHGALRRQAGFPVAMMVGAPRVLVMVMVKLVEGLRVRGRIARGGAVSGRASVLVEGMAASFLNGPLEPPRIM